MDGVAGSRNTAEPAGANSRLDFRNEGAVAAWIASLSPTDHRGAARQIQGVLRQALTETLPLRQLFEFLEQLGRPVAGVLEGLRKYHGEIRFPLPERVKGVAEQSDDLCELLILGYQSVLREIHGSSITDENSPFAGVWQIVAHRILYYSFGIVQRSGFLNGEGRNNLWLRVNRIYFTAVKEHLIGQRVAFEGVPGYPVCTIDHLYKRLLLISLVPLHALRAQQMAELAGSLDIWAERVATRVCGPERDRGRMPFQIDPANDQGPCYSITACADCERGRCMLMDNGRLLKQIHQAIVQALQVEQEQVCLENGNFISVSTLEILKRCWGDRPRRTDDRIPVPVVEEIELTASVASLHALLTHPEPATPAVPPKPAATHYPQAPVIDRVSMESHGMENYGKETAEKSAWDERHHKAPSRFHQAQIRDRSSNGLGLEIAVQPDIRLRVGDLLGLRGVPGEEPLLLAVVRWLRQADAERLDCGVLVLADRIHAAELVADQGEKGDGKGGGSVPCLLAEHRRSRKTMLVLDYFPVIRNKLFVLGIGEAKIPIAFAGWPLEESRAFEAFEFGRRHGTESRPAADEPLLQMEELLALAAAKKEKQDEKKENG